MPQNPTIPPVPKRPPAKPIKIPPVTETHGSRSYHVDPYHGINQIRPMEAPKRHATPSEVDLHVVRHDEQLKAHERRIGDLEGVADVVDKKLDKISDAITKSDNERALEKAIKDDEKVKEDQKTKRVQAILIAIPLILSPILGFASSYLSKPTPDYKTDTVIVSEYNQDAAECRDKSKGRDEFVACIRKAQLKNTPNFEK